MRDLLPKVLFFKKADADKIQLLHECGLAGHFVEVLDISSCNVSLTTAPEYALVSSLKALKSLAKQPKIWDLLTETTFFTVGQSSHAFLSQKGKKIAETADSAAELWPKIQKYNLPSIHFFCSQQHLPYLPQKLEAHGTEVVKIICYRSRMTYPKVDFSEADAACFFSPRGVESVLTHNHLPENKAFTIAAIGKTTANALQSAGIANVVVPPKADFYSLIQKIKKCLKKK